VLRGCRSGLRRHAPCPAGHRFDHGDLFRVQRGSQPAGVGEAGAGQRLRVDRGVFGREQGAATVWGRSRPAFAHLVAIQPVAAQPRLALAGHILLKSIGRGVVECDRRDARPPEGDVDARRFRQRGSQGLVQVARPHREADERVVGRLDLCRQHPRGRRGGCGGVGPGLEDGDLQAAGGRGSGTRRPHRPAADDRDVDGLHALALP